MEETDGEHPSRRGSGSGRPGSVRHASNPREAGRPDRDAARRGANLVVFPEAFVAGYPKGLDFGARLGIRLPEGREDFRRYFESAIDVPGPATEAIGAAASAAAVHLVVGVIERDGGTLYCTALIFGPDGRLLGKHRKLMPTAMERLVWGFGDGSTLPVVDTPLGRLGSVICWENYMPLLRMAMYAKGIQLYCAPTVDDRETWLPTMRHDRARGPLLRPLGLPVSDAEPTVRPTTAPSRATSRRRS